MARKFRAADPTAAAAIGNVESERKAREAAASPKERRGIVEEFPEIFADLSLAQAMTITLAAGKLAEVGDAWAITAEHLEQAKVNYFRNAH